MKKYRLKEHYKTILKVPNPDAINDWDYWSNYFMTKEPLEEVPSRIELNLCDGEYQISKNFICKKDGDFKFEEKDLCEKALNGELLDINSINDVDFLSFYSSKESPNVSHEGIKAVLKAYLNK